MLYLCINKNDKDMMNYYVKSPFGRSRKLCYEDYCEYFREAVRQHVPFYERFHRYGCTLFLSQSIIIF